MDLFEFDPELNALAERADVLSAEARAEADRISAVNGKRVLSAFVKNRVSEACLGGTTGYGYGDIGRDTIDRVFADALGAEAALVRHTFVSGTHALSVALFGILRTGDKLVAITGKPYDTLEQVIGISQSAQNGVSAGSLADFGVSYGQLDLLPDGTPDYASLPDAVRGARVVYIQRSRGYSLRPAMSIAVIEKLIAATHAAEPNAIVMVDNCYGEFVEECEPTAVGADLIIGSLIKNPGGAIAKTGGYIAGRAKLVELCAARLTCVGMGSEVGCTLGTNRDTLLGFFLAPEIVASAIKTSCFACELFRLMGFECFPAREETRSDIITAIKLGSEKALVAFCRGIQQGSPVDSFAAPEPWDMPGYDSKVIMAAGAFTMGASIELSADAPLREPFAVWLQGGITYTSGRLGVLSAAASLRNIDK